MHDSDENVARQEFDDLEYDLRKEILILRQQIGLLNLKIELLAEAVGNINAVH